MKHNNRWAPFVILTIAAVLLVGCAQTEAGAASKEEPVRLEAMAGTDFNMITLTGQAAQRLDIQTEAAREEQVQAETRLVVPYSAVLYGLNGETWVFVNPAPLTYHRQPITIDFIEGNIAVLSRGPSPGTEVVTMGVAELYGVDTGVGQ